MKLLGMLLLCISFFYLSSAAQQSDSLTNKSFITSNALQFNFINETAIYYYFNMSSSSSLRIGFSLFWNYSESSPSNEKYHSLNSGSSPDTIDETYSSSSTNNYYNAVISALYIFSLNKSSQLQINLGIGPAFTYYYSRSTSSGTAFHDSIRDESSNNYFNKNYGAGLLVCCQVLVPLNSSLQLIAEYSLLGSYVWQNYESNYSYSYFTYNRFTSSRLSQQSSDSHGWQFSLNRVTFGIKYSF